MIRTYDGLQDEVKEWLSRTTDPFYDDVFDLSLQLCETRVRKRLRTRQMQDVAEIQAVAGRTLFDLPADYSGVRGTPYISGEFGDFPLDYMSPVIPNQTLLAIETGVPQAYYIYGDRIATFPRATEDFIILLPYYRRLLALSEEQQTNWLIEKYPDVYFNGVMYYSQLFLHNFKSAQSWYEKYLTALYEVNNIDKFDRFGVKGNQMRSPIVPLDSPLSRRRRIA